MGLARSLAILPRDRLPSFRPLAPFLDSSQVRMVLQSGGMRGLRTLVSLLTMSITCRLMPLQPLAAFLDSSPVRLLLQSGGMRGLRTLVSSLTMSLRDRQPIGLLVYLLPPALTTRTADSLPSSLTDT